MENKETSTNVGAVANEPQNVFAKTPAQNVNPVLHSTAQEKKN